MHKCIIVQFLYNSVRFLFKHSVPPPVCHWCFFLLFAAGESADTRVVVLGFLFFFCLFACLFFPLCDCMTLSSPLSHSTASLQVSLPILFRSEHSAECDDSSYSVKDVNCCLCSAQHLLLFSSPSLSFLWSLSLLHPPSVSVYEALSRSSALSHVDVDGQEE